MKKILFGIMLLVILVSPVLASTFIGATAVSQDINFGKHLVIDSQGTLWSGWRENTTSFNNSLYKSLNNGTTWAYNRSWTGCGDVATFFDMSAGGNYVFILQGCANGLAAFLNLYSININTGSFTTVPVINSNLGGNGAGSVLTNQTHVIVVGGQQHNNFTEIETFKLSDLSADQDIFIYNIRTTGAGAGHDAAISNNGKIVYFISSAETFGDCKFGSYSFQTLQSNFSSVECSTSDAQQKGLIVDELGNIHRLYGNAGNIKYAKSTDNGQNWTTSTLGAGVPPHLFIRKNVIVALWSNLSAIKYRISKNYGNDFASEVIYNNTLATPSVSVRGETLNADSWNNVPEFMQFVFATQASSDNIFYDSIFIKDETSPVVSIVQIPSGRPVNLTINFTTSDNVAIDSCFYSLDNTPNISLPECMNTTFITSIGTHALTIFANDTSNNNGSSMISFQVTPPVLTGNVAAVVRIYPLMSTLLILSVGIGLMFFGHKKENVTMMITGLMVFIFGLLIVELMSSIVVSLTT